jgi:hypothetical protein
MRKIRKLCKNGLLGPGDYGFFEDWSAIDKLRNRCIRIKDGLVSEGEVQEMKDEENFYDKGPSKECVHEFFLAYHQVVAYHCWLLFCPAELERFCEFEVNLSAGNVSRLLAHAFLSNGMKFLALVHTSGKHKRGFELSIDCQSYGRAR